MVPRLKDVSRKLVRRNYAEIPGFGARVALDSTTLKAWSNGSKEPKADTDAGWSVKTGSQGAKEYVYAVSSATIGGVCDTAALAVS